MSATGSAPAGASSLGFRPGLDGVRAIAVLAVIAYHLGAGWMRGGFLGVDLFMVLSGYLITSLLLLEHERSGRVSLVAFWQRRARRILPAVILLLITLAAYSLLWATPVERASLRWDSLAALTSWANWRFVFGGSGYWAQFGPPSPLTHFWSLAVEEQFYVVWPLVVAGLLVAARGRRWVVAGLAAVGIAASAVAMAVLFDPLAPSRSYLGTDTRVQTLLVGALGAALLRPGPHRLVAGARWSGALGSVAAVVVLAALVFVGDQESWMYHGGFTAFAVVALVLVVAAGEAPGPVRRILSLPALNWIGRRSFGWYLWHWPLIVLLTPERLGVDGSVRVVVLLALTVSTAEISFRLVEQPVRSGALRLRTRQLPMGAIASVAVLVTGAALVLSTRVQIPERPDLTSDAFVLDPGLLDPGLLDLEVIDLGPHLGHDDAAGPEPSLSGEPFPSVGLIPTVLEPQPSIGEESHVPDVSARPVDRVVIQGDSVALFSAMPMVEAFAAAGIAVENRTFAGQSLANPIVVEVVGQSGADLSIWQLSLWDTADPDEVRRDHERFVEASFAIGADVVFVDRPPIREDLETEERQLTRRIAAELVAAHPARVHLLDPSVLWGDTVVLDRDGDGLPERFRDQVHVCPQGSARWTAWLLESLALRYSEVSPGPIEAWIDGDWLDDPNWASNPGECDPL